MLNLRVDEFRRAPVRLTLDPVFMPSKTNGFKYQRNVAAIVQNAAGQILICERVDTDGAWQFPQGSVEKGESKEAALRRELWEEIGLGAKSFRVLGKRGPYRYVYGRGRQKKGYDGKEQYYFLVELTSEPVKLDLHTTTPEFQAHKWIEPGAFREKWLPGMKREVYRKVFEDFFGINLATF
jgi:putative (di)nucleoside polyphosphate hydrolase